MWHLLADIHFDIKTLSRLQSFFEFYLARFEQTRPDHVMLLGDTFNVRTGTDTHLHRVFTDYLRRMLDAPQSPRIHLLIGNHDMKNRFDRTDNALYPFGLLRKQVHVYQEITRTCLDGHEAVFIPYHHDESQVARYIRSEPSDRVASTIAFFHGSFRGAIRNGASDSGHGVCHDSVIDSTNLGRYRRAFLGHFHTHGSPPLCPNVTYVGSPIQSNMGDAGDLSRGFIEYNPKVDTWNLIVNPEAEYYLNMSWAESVVNLDRVCGKKIRLTLETTDQDEAVWTDEAMQRHIDDLYTHGAHHVELRQALPPIDIAESSMAAGKVISASSELKKQQLHDNALQEIRDLVPSFLRAGQTLVDTAGVGELSSVTINREKYLLSIIDDHCRQHGVVTPAEIFDAELLRVEMCDFRGISGKSTFSLDALSPGTVFLVTSNNGNGKSTLLEAIFWCLYGKFLDPDVNAEEAIHTGKRSCNVTLYFRNGYKFTRSRIGKRPIFEIFHNGAVVERGHDAGTTTQYLESHLLHMNSETFRRTFVISDHATSAFLATRDAQRTKSLDLMFGLELLRDVRSRLEEDFRDHKKHHAEVQADCDKANEALLMLESSRQQGSSELDNWRRDIQSKKITLQVLKQRNEEIRGLTQRKNGSIQSSRHMKENLESRIAQLRHHVRLYQTMETLEAKLTQARQQIELHHLNRITKVQAEVERQRTKLHQAVQNVGRTRTYVERYQIPLAKEGEKYEHTWAQFYAFANRLSRYYLSAFINAALHVGSQIPWFNRLFAPVMQRSLKRLSIKSSLHAAVYSQDEMRSLVLGLRKSEALLQSLTEETRKGLHNPNLEREDEGKETSELGLINDDAHPSRSELRLPPTSQLVHETQALLKFAELEHMDIQSSLMADERDHLALVQQNHEMSCNIAHEDGHLEQMIRQESSYSQKADELMQQHRESIKFQKRSMEVRSEVETKLALSAFWLEQLQDTPTQKGPFITYCRSNHIRSLNVVIAQVLDELNQDSEGIATQRLHFQLKPDYTLEPTQGALSIGKRSKGQKTRTYLALFLAMFQQARSRLPFRASFVFLDEVMDTLDLHGIEALQRWLQRYVAARRMQAFLMTHRETTLVGNVIEVTRDRKRGTEYKLRQQEKPE